MSIYTYSERTQKNYTFQDAINNAYGRVAFQDTIRNSILVKKHPANMPLTLEEVNSYADRIVRGF